MFIDFDKINAWEPIPVEPDTLTTNTHQHGATADTQPLSAVIERNGIAGLYQ